MATVPARTGALWFLLGMAQMFGAVTSAMLLVSTGLTGVTLLAVTLTTVLTVVSRVMSRRQ